MTRGDINDIISAICPNDEDYEKPCISPKYLRQELEQLALDQRQWNGEPTTKNDLGVDCISRADALALYCDKCGVYNCISKCASYRAVEKMPSVTPQESVLDKIRAEIEQNAYPIVHGVNNHEKGMTLYGILQIFDKYKAESEDKE